MSAEVIEIIEDLIFALEAAARDMHLRCHPLVIAYSACESCAGSRRMIEKSRRSVTGAP